MARPRPIRIVGDVAYVPLTKGYEAVIDAADVPLVEGVNWFANVTRRRDGSVRCVYAVRFIGPMGARRLKSMHRVVLSPPEGFITDHKDGDGLNNRRSNLRPAKFSDNSHNTRMPITNTSGVKGVTWDKNRGAWSAAIMANGKKVDLGRYADLSNAAAAYAKASAALHGEFGRLA